MVRWLVSTLIILLLVQTYADSRSLSSSKLWHRLVKSMSFPVYTSMTVQKHERQSLCDQLLESFIELYHLSKENDMYRNIFFICYSTVDSLSGMETSKLVSEFSQIYSKLDKLTTTDLHHTVVEAKIRYCKTQNILLDHINKVLDLIDRALKDHRNEKVFEERIANKMGNAQEYWSLCHEQRKEETPPVDIIREELRYIVETLFLYSLRNNPSNILKEAVSCGRNHLFYMDLLGKKYNLTQIDQLMDQYARLFGPPSDVKFDAFRKGAKSSPSKEDDFHFTNADTR